MKKTKHFKRTALPLSAKSMVSLMLLLIAMLLPQRAWAAACAKLPDSKTYEVMSVHYNGTASNYNGSADNDVLGSLKFRYWLDVFNYDGDNGYWAKDLTMKIDDETLTFYSDYACTTKVSAEYSTVLHGVWPVFDNSDEDHATIGKGKSGSGNKAYFMTSSGLKGYIDIFSFYAASDKWTTMRVEVFIYDLYGHKVSVCGTYKRKGASDKAYNFVYYLGGCPRPKNVTTSRNTTTKQVTVSWQKETYSIPASDAAGETRRDAFSVIDNGYWGVYLNDNYTTSIQTVGNTVTSAADNSASCSSSPYTYDVCYEPIATYGSNSKSLTGSETSKRGLVGSSSITLNHVWGDSGSEKDPATCTTAAVHYQTCIYCSRTSDDNHIYTSGSAKGHKYTTYAYNNDATCQKAGTKTASCDNGCGTKSTVADPAHPKCDHKYTTYAYNNDATCQKAGTKTASCDFGCGTKSTVADSAHPKCDHKYTTYTYNDDATCQQAGTKTASCDFGCGTTNTMDDPEHPMIAHNYANHVCTACSADEEPITGTQGECTWRIYASDGEMIVSPTNGVSGSLGDWGRARPSWLNSRAAIKSVRFTGTVMAETLYRAFECYAIKSIDFTNLNTSQVKDMNGLFMDCMSLNSINWGSFDTSNATNMYSMFSRCSNLKSLDLRCFNTSNVTDMDCMFYWCTILTSVDLSNFDMSKATNCTNMFDLSYDLSTLTLTSVPYLKAGTFDTKFAGKTVVCKLDEKSTIYKGENPGFPTVASVTAPCSLDLTGSVVEKHANLTRTHSYTEESDADAYLASAASCSTDATYFYKCANCTEHNSETWTKTGTRGHHYVDGHCSVCGDASGPMTVTLGNGEVRKYNSLQEAINNILDNGLNDATLTLHQDLTLEGNEDIEIIFGEDGDDFNFTIDLNGHTITGSREERYNYFDITNSESGLPTLTIANSCQDKKGKLFNCRLDLNENTKVIVSEGVSIYPKFENLDFASSVVYFYSATSSLVNYGDLYGDVDVSLGNSFINYGRVEFVYGEFENHGGYCAYFNWADDGLSFSAYVNGLIYDYNEEDEDYSITSEVTKEPTCSEPGVRTFTGSFIGDLPFGGQEFTDTKEVEIPATGHHTFAASDLTHDVCTVCNHGFLRYEAGSQQNPYKAENLKDKGDNTLQIVSHTFSDGKGVIEFNAPLVKIEDLAFFASDIKGITIPNTVEIIGATAFSSNRLISAIEIPNSVKIIGSSAFYGCIALTKITLGSSVEKINGYAFSCDEDQSDKDFDITLKSLPQFVNCDYPEIFHYKCIYYDEYVGCVGVEDRPIPANFELDDNSYVAPESSLGSSCIANHVTYTRTGIKNQWGTIVVPFEVNGSGDDYDLYTLSGVSNEELTLTKVSGTLAAGTPALIRLHDKLAGDYDLTLTAANNAVSGQFAERTEVDGYQLVGTYETTELEDNDYFISKNMFWEVGDVSAEGVKAAPFRAYIHPTSAGSNARMNAPASPTELKRLDADGNGVIETADIDLMVASILNGENDYSIGDVVRAIDNAGTSVATGEGRYNETLSNGQYDGSEPEQDGDGWVWAE